MAATRRARTLVTGIQSSLGAALALADRLDEQADELERGGAAADGGGGAGAHCGPLTTHNHRITEPPHP
ncbi:hypothetical protein [Frankia sp. AgKG'84/4]|uniref:hypothetical protein n=1 Tax=Frankia sp. AgKG'84/4 TaxID=573490 RepID=UPI00202A2805|nr:hypothetical protein [Frankia sp. AgKG'84/4]MCL9798096.1 hypothetical protein [Frankia sp. AgKG'84/4]